MPRPVLITAGATRNRLDAMRCITAFSSGRTGVELAQALAPHAPVHLLGSPEALLRAGPGLDGEEYEGTRDLMARVERWVHAHPGGVVLHAAAVGDYEAEPLAGKIASGAEELVLRLRPTPKILDHIRAWDPGVFLVSFKAAGPETSPAQLIALCQAQRARSGSDLVFGNVLGQLGTTAVLVDANGAQAFAERGAAVAALVGRVGEASGWRL